MGVVLFYKLSEKFMDSNALSQPYAQSLDAVQELFVDRKFALQYCKL